jgi:hypothetical protein
MGEAARERTLKLFASQKVIGEMLVLYQKILSRH